MFELHITCTKDFDELSIKFSDGTSIVKVKESKEPKESEEKSPVKPQPKQKQDKPKREKTLPERADEFLNLDADFGSVSQDIVQKPDVTLQERPIKVAEELQNLDI